MIHLIQRFFGISPKAIVEPIDPTEEIEASRTARHDIMKTRDAFLQDGRAEVRRQEDIRAAMTGDFLMDDLFGPEPRGTRR